MPSAAELFAIQLGRAAQRSRRFLRYLSTSDRDDVLAATLLRCWENRGSYDPAVSLEAWFEDHLKTARREYRREPSHISTEKLGELIAPDNTERHASAAQILEDMTPAEQQCAELLADGYSVRVVVQQGFQLSVVKAVKGKLRRLEDLAPDAFDQARAARAPRPRDSDELAPIDHEIERMLRKPATSRADCPVCWRCCYFLGLLPKNYRPPRIEDAEVQTCVHHTELRKIEIAST